jgi:hypothetical protein
MAMKSLKRRNTQEDNGESMFKNELHRHRWIQSHLTKLKTPEEQLEIKFCGGHHCRETEIETDMVELHVDAHATFHERMNATTQFGGNLSVWMPSNTKPLMCLGQFIFTGKASWTAPNGQKPVIPKGEGLGAMTSTFVSREFGFGIELSDKELQTVNEHKQGKNHSNRSAALDKRGTFAKHLITG